MFCCALQVVDVSSLALKFGDVVWLIDGVATVSALSNSSILMALHSITYLKNLFFLILSNPISLSIFSLDFSREMVFYDVNQQMVLSIRLVTPIFIHSTIIHTYILKITKTKCYLHSYGEIRISYLMNRQIYL